jgi:V/A-type H+-transporting ATPase subunit I
MAVNTVSFLRVGAFALAHAGLSVAIVGLSQAAGSRALQALVLVVGNLFVLALEAMVVGIQTTRLVLFEFFIRFLRGTGRAFRPLPGAPLSSTQGQGGSA